MENRIDYTLSGLKNLLTTYEGRVSRLQYLAGCIMLLLAFWVAFFVVGGVSALVGEVAILGFILKALTLIILVICVLLTVLILIKRTHDIGWSAWLILLMLVPVVNLVYLGLMFFMPGKAEANQWGNPPSK